MIRLDKFLVDLGIGTRSEVKKYIASSKVSINGQIVKKADTKFEPEHTEVRFENQILNYQEFVYFMLHKPAGCVTANSDNLHTTVMDYIKEGRKGLVPVGRLDIDTEGLLLITNDGDLNHRLLSPSHHVPKIYYAKIEGELPKDAILRMQEGLVLEDGLETKPAKLEILDRNEQGTQVNLTIYEGKFHQVKRMFAALHTKVVYLKRLSMGSLHLDESLLPGEYRRLTAEEVDELKRH